MSSSVDPKQPPTNRTVMLHANRAVPPETHNTDYELSHSSQIVSSTLQTAESSSAHPAAEPSSLRRAFGQLDAETRALFHQRLRLCCLIAAVPFGFFVVCAATNFIQLLSRDTVGWTGLGLAIFTLICLAGSAGFLFRRQMLDEKWLRVLELAIFGIMATCIAYWEFAVLTATPGLVDADYQNMPSMTEQVYVLAAALFVHFCWFVLIVFHGVLVPNTLARGVGVAFGMCVTAVAISVIVVFTHPATGRNAGVLFAVSTTMLGAAVGLSVFGTAKTEELREEVRTAREAMRELGQYRLRRKLGHGGMGEVYLAEHRLLKRPCALKRIHPRFVHNADQLRRFEREVQATAGLRHPNTVEIYDYGQADDGTFFYVMEFVPGMNLEEMVLKYGPLPPDRVVYILRQVCGALREAHRHDLVHRDIKPSNILVVSNGHPHDLAKLVDFGLVHSVSPNADDPEHKLTRDGLIVGTPEYMSPEQASAGLLDARSDLFSLGSVAYFLLSGREAFHRGNAVKTLMAVVNEEPEPIGKLNPFIPADLLAALQTCMAKSPQDRFQTAADLEAALSRCDCAQGWSESRASEWWTRNSSRLADPGTDLASLPLRADAESN